VIRQASRGYLDALHRVPQVLDDGTVLPGLWHRLDVDPPTHTDVHPDLIAEAFVNDGRWVVTCGCGGAQLASRARPLFYCLDCAGEAHGFKWLAIVFPRDADAIEAVIARRPDPLSRRWNPGETVEDLTAENAANGVG
jgi:hypothetical protein